VPGPATPARLEIAVPIGDARERPTTFEGEVEHDAS
jgi:hypothetical protein